MLRAVSSIAYEEGTWTPAVDGSSGAITYNSRNARYTKTGRLVTVEFWISVATTTLAGSLSISGLPFTSGSVAVRPSSVFRAFNTLATGLVGGWISNSSSSITLIDMSAGSATNLDGTDIQANCEIGGTLTYSV